MIFVFFQFLCCCGNCHLLHFTLKYKLQTFIIKRKHMKRVGLIIVIVSAWAFTFKEQTEKVALKDALTQKIISMQALKNPGSTHYSRPVLLKVQNTTAQELKIEVPIGYRFQPKDTNLQPMLVIRPELFVLQPNEKKDVVIYAMCMAHSKGAASEGMTYTLTTPAKNNLLSIAQKVNELKAYNYEGQQAIWSISDNGGPEDISGADTAQVNKLRAFVCKLTGKKMPPPRVLNDYRYNYYAPIVNVQERIWGEYEFKFSKEKSIEIAMFGRGNTVVRQLYKNDAEKPGKHIFKYEFDSSVYTDEAYKIMFIVDGTVMATRNLNLRDWRNSH